MVPADPRMMIWTFCASECMVSMSSSKVVSVDMSGGGGSRCIQKNPASLLQFVDKPNMLFALGKYLYYNWVLNPKPFTDMILISMSPRAPPTAHSFPTPSTHPNHVFNTSPYIIKSKNYILGLVLIQLRPSAQLWLRQPGGQMFPSGDPIPPNP